MLQESEWAAAQRAQRVMPSAASRDEIRYRILNRMRADEPEELLRLKNGLLARRARIDPKYFYDTAGSALFSDICAQPEYYLTRTEARIFSDHRSEIVWHLPRGAQWIDLGCGDGAKSQPWIATVRPRRYLGLDIAPEALERALQQIGTRFPAVECAGVVCDFSRLLPIEDIVRERPAAPPVLFYPGSSLGNFSTAQAFALLKSFRKTVGSRGCLLIGVDLVRTRASSKPPMTTRTASPPRSTAMSFEWSIGCSMRISTPGNSGTTPITISAQRASRCACDPSWSTASASGPMSARSVSARAF